ncbi:ABC transporter ATP-binding protein [Magnetococcales bacterium HHB-1]
MNTQSDIALGIKGLDKTYSSGMQALKSVDLEIHTGEFFAILGPNGAGKSTLINIVAQVVHKTAGDVKVFGLSIDEDPQGSKMLLGVTPQEYALDMFFSVREVLKNFSGYYGIADNESWTESLLTTLGLQDKGDVNARKLSGGMKRRLSIAKALVHKPPLLILDEPTAGVDVELRHALWTFIRELHAAGTTIILTTHYLEEAQELADRVAILRDGKIVACDHVQNLLHKFGSRKFELKFQQPESMQRWLAQNSFSEQVTSGEMDRQNHRVSGAFSVQQSPRFFAQLAEYAEDIQDLKMDEATLEEVFLKLTQDNHGQDT